AVVVVRDRLGLHCHGLALLHRLHDGGAHPAHGRGRLLGIVTQLLERVGGDVARRVLPGRRARLTTAATAPDQEAESTAETAGPDAAPTARDVGMRAATAALAQRRI